MTLAGTAVAPTEDAVVGEKARCLREISEGGAAVSAEEVLFAVLRLLAASAVAPIRLMPVVWPLFALALVVSVLMTPVVLAVRRRVRARGMGSSLPFESRGRLIAFLFVFPLAVVYLFVAGAVFVLVLVGRVALA